MNSTYLDPFSKAILTGLFAGIMATLVCLGINIFYREATLFPLSSIINVSSLIFFTNFVFLLIGVVYYGLIRMGKGGERLFVLLFLLLTAFLAWRAAYAHRSNDPLLNHEFHQLLTGIVLAMGLIAALGIPFLYHSRKFEEHVL